MGLQQNSQKCHIGQYSLCFLWPTSTQLTPWPASVVLTGPTQVTGTFALLVEQRQRVEGAKTPSAL